jgi:hypothetical protein
MTMQNFDDMQKHGKDHMDSAMKAWNQASKGIQALAAETAEYSKKSFEESCAAFEKLRGAKSLETVVEIQTAHTKAAYEGFVGQMTKMGEICMNLAKETSQSFENHVSNAPAARQAPDAPLRAETERSRDAA